jgi:hypothetical protein
LPILVTNIGTNTGASGTTLAVTVPAGGVPARQLLIVCVTEKSTSGTSGTLADNSASPNTWNTAIGVNLNAAAASGRGTLFYAWNSHALAAGNTITYTRNLSGASCAMSAFWVSGILNNADPRLSAVQNSATGTTGTITVTTASNAPQFSWVLGVLFDSGSSVAGGNATFTQAAGYATPPNEATTGGSAGSRVDGGNRYNTGAAASFTYNPTLSSTAQLWADVITAFQAIPDTFFIEQRSELASPAAAVFRPIDQFSSYTARYLLNPPPSPPDTTHILRPIWKSLPDQPHPPNAFQPWTWTYNWKLLGKDTMIVGRQSWERPTLPIPPTPTTQTVTASYNLNLIGKDRMIVGEQSTDRPTLPPIPSALSWTFQLEAQLTFVAAPTLILRPIWRSLPDQPAAPLLQQSTFPSVIYLGKVQRPFLQTDWPNPQAQYRNFSWAFQLQAQLIPPVVSVPYNIIRPIWRSLPDQPAAPLLQQSTFPSVIYLGKVQRPFLQTDWPNPTPAYRLDQTYSWRQVDKIGQDAMLVGKQVTDLPPEPAIPPENVKTWIQLVQLTLVTAPPNLFAQARQQDWPIPRGNEPDWRRSWESWYNRNLIGKDQLPNRQSDWPVPTPAPRPDETWIQQALKVVQAPFSQVDWPLTPAAGRGVDLSTWIGRAANLIAKPFNQQDWPNPTPLAREPGLASWAASYNKNLIGQDLLPLRQVDWPTPVTAQQAAQSWIDLTKFWLAANPFAQRDWPLPAPPSGPALGWQWAYNLNLVGKDKLPSRQSDWPLTPAPVREANLGSWGTFTNLGFFNLPVGRVVYDLSPIAAPRGSLDIYGWVQGLPEALRPQPKQPFNQFDWPLPTYPFRLDQTFAPPVFPQIIPPPIPIVAASYRLLCPHQLIGPSGVAIWYPQNTVVTEGIEIRFGWIPSLAVDPLNLEAVNAYYAAGPRSVAYDDNPTFGGAIWPTWGQEMVPMAPPVTHWAQVPGTKTYALTGLGISKPPIGGQ